MKILVITQLYPLSDDSQDSKAIHYFVKEWSRDHEVKVLRPYFLYEKNGKPKSDNFFYDGIEVNIYHPIWIPLLKVSVVNAKKIIDNLDFEPDVVVSHLYNSYINFGKFFNRKNIPFIVGIHKSDFRMLSSFFYRKRLIKAIHRGNAIAYRAEHLKDKVSSKIGEYINPTFIAHSGVPDSYIQNASNLLNSGYHNNITKKILTACQLIELKQVDKILIGLKQLLDDGFANWEYSIIGDGPQFSILKKMSVDLGIENKVKFLGRLSRVDVFEEMKTSDVFVMPSYKETLGIAYLEAMAAGCIVIGAKGWGIDGVIKDNENGFLCNPYSQDSISMSIKKALVGSENELEQILGESLMTIINFSEQKVANDYLNFIKSVVSNSSEC